MLSNYQFRNLGGEGYMRLLEFLADGRTVKVYTYSPLYDAFMTDADQNLTLTLDVPQGPARGRRRRRDTGRAPGRAMSTDLVLTLLGPDRPGLVEAVAQAIVASGGNWVESRMARLAGKFAGVLRVEIPTAAVEALREALARLETAGACASCSSRAKARPAVASRSRSWSWSCWASIAPGLVREVSRLLAAQHINVEELITDRSSAPMSGEMMFRARARLAVPAGGRPGGGAGQPRAAGRRPDGRDPPGAERP